MRKFLFEYNRYNDGTVSPNGWWEIDGNRLVNQAGGWHHYEPSPDDKIVEAESFDDLDYSYLLNPKSEYGWVSPDGRFYGCDYHQHETIADHILHMPGSELERKGWVKIYMDSFKRTKDWWCMKYLTEYQKATLEKHGFKV